MKKDIIYIDIEDDITAIIGKVKDSKDKIIALVPPKQSSVLQSAVNLRLLARTSKTDKKSLVLITNNQALSGLAASVKIPVAKNLQSKPEIAEIPALDVDDGDDVIDGSQLPVGELVKTTGASADTSGNKKVDEIIDDLDDPSDSSVPKTPPRKASKNDMKALKQKGAKVPDFNKFRKRLFIIIGIVIILIGFLVWAIKFAPAAKIIITAQTTSETVNTQARLSTSTTNVESSTLRSTTKQTEKEVSVDFEATGTQTKGERATGVLTLTRSLGGSVNVPAGTRFSNGNYVFTTTSSVVVPGASVGQNSTQLIPGTVDINVTAAAIGPEYNLSARSYTSSINGIAAYGEQMSGGSRETVKIVTASDIQTASEKLASQSDDDVKEQLGAEFGDDFTVIDDSYTIDRASAVSTPAVGEEATGTAKLTSKATYSLTAISNSDLETYLKGILTSQLVADGKTDQDVYDSGVSKVSFKDYSGSGDTRSVIISTTGQIGPKIDEDAIKEQVKGKRYGDIQSELGKIEGVNDVDVQFSFFWVRTVPNDNDKIEIEFELSNG